MKRTTFTKKPIKRNVINVPGVLPSLHNGLLLTSSGIPTLDDVVGGGLPVGSVVLIEEDIHNRFSKIVLKYFLAEGIMCRHSLFVASMNEDPKLVVDQLPKPVSSRPLKPDQSTIKDDMKIAFMYKDLPKNPASLSNVSKYGHYYDISATMDSNLIDLCNVKTLKMNDEQSSSSSCDVFRSLLHKLQNYLDCHPEHQPPTKLTQDDPLNVLRLALPNFASPLWCEDNVEDVKHISNFLHSLRAIARNSVMVALVAIPTHLFSPHQVAVFRHLVDCSIELKAFIGEKNPAFKQYHGLFNIHKLPCLNSLTSVMPESFDLAFELKKTKFSIECLHLPPDTSETASRQGMDETALKSKTLCGGTTLSKNLDF